MDQQDYREKLRERLDQPIVIDPRRNLIAALEYIKAEPVMFLGYSAFLLTLALFTLRIQLVGTMINVFLMPPLVAGYFAAAKRIDRGEKLHIYHFFDGFSRWLNIFVATTLSGLLIFLGVIMLVAPGIYLGVAYILVIPFIMFSGMDFWEAMEASRKLITKAFWGALGLILILLLINLLGVLLFGLGIVFTLPLTYLSIYTTFKNILHQEEPVSFPKNNNTRKTTDFSHFR